MDPEAQKLLLQAGKIASQVKHEGANKLAMPGASFLEVMDYCEKRIRELGGQIAWAQMAVNDAAAHYCPTEEDATVSKEGDIIKVDMGVHINGYLADNAMTVVVGSSSEHKDLVKAAQNALKSAVKLARPGTPLWQLGEAQYSEAEAFGFTTVKNLSGHAIGRYKVHGGVSIPSFNNKDKTELKENWQIAIEPFVTNGQGLIKEKGPATIFMIGQERGVRSPHAKKILDYVKTQQGLPFTTRWLTRQFGKGSAALGMRELQQRGIIRSYPPLVEISGGMVSQFEHSVIVKDRPVVYTRTELDEW